MRVNVRLCALIALLAVGRTLAAQDANPMVGGEAMFPDCDIVSNAVRSVDHTTLVAAVSTYDVYQSNGVILVVDRVLLPR